MSSNQGKGFYYLYKTLPGRCVLKILIQPWLSKLSGKVLSGKFSQMIIPRFIASNNIGMTEYVEKDYISFNDFFTREIRPETRPMSANETDFISPADSLLTVLPITQDGILTLEETPYTVASLLQDEVLAAQFYSGYALIFRLCANNYHHYCYSVSGEEKGYFEYGGSTVVVLAPAERLTIRKEFIEASARSIETKVRYHETVGKLQD